METPPNHQQIYHHGNQSLAQQGLNEKEGYDWRSVKWTMSHDHTGMTSLVHIIIEELWEGIAPLETGGCWELWDRIICWPKRFKLVRDPQEGRNVWFNSSPSQTTFLSVSFR